MTNVLKLFWQPEALQQQQKEKVLPLPKQTKKRQHSLIEQEVNCEKVNYTCLKCGKQSEFGTSTSIQCPKCNYRVLEKIRSSKKQITYDAV